MWPMLHSAVKFRQIRAFWAVNEFVKQRFICSKYQEGCLFKILRIKPNYLISLILRRRKSLLPPADEVLGKLKFLHLSVCPRRGRGGRYIMMSLPVMDNINWKSPPPDSTTHAQHLPRQSTSPRQHPPYTSGWYASYCNALLFYFKLLWNNNCTKTRRIFASANFTRQIFCNMQ